MVSNGSSTASGVPTVSQDMVSIEIGACGSGTLMSRTLRAQKSMKRLVQPMLRAGLGTHIEHSPFVIGSDLEIPGRIDISHVVSLEAEMAAMQGSTRESWILNDSKQALRYMGELRYLWSLIRGVEEANCADAAFNLLNGNREKLILTNQLYALLLNRILQSLGVLPRETGRSGILPLAKTIISKWKPRTTIEWDAVCQERVSAIMQILSRSKA